MCSPLTAARFSCKHRRHSSPPETSENWTEEKLREVIAAKMGGEAPREEETVKGKNTQERYDIVCKHFIDAVESGK